ncbi:hypothetical protein Tco_0020363 [Tanacetum coccineum]
MRGRVLRLHRDERLLALFPEKGTFVGFIKSSVDDLGPPIPTSRRLAVGKQRVVDFLMKNVDVAGLPRHLVKYLFNNLIKHSSLTKGMSDEPLGDDSKLLSYDVTFSTLAL